MTDRTDEISAPAPLAYLLAPVSGFVDVVAFVMLAGVFASSMSGNAVRLAVEFGEWGDALARAVPIVLFVVGVALAIGVVSAVGRRVTTSSLAPLLTVEVVLIALFMLVGTLAFDGKSVTENSARFYVLVPFPVVAMTMQTIVLRRVANVPVQTAYVTSMLVFVAGEAVEALAGWSTPRGAEARHRIRIHGGVWLAYLAGGCIGVPLLEKAEYMALAVPLAVLVVVLIVVRTPASYGDGAA